MAGRGHPYSKHALRYLDGAKKGEIRDHDSSGVYEGMTLEDFGISPKDEEDGRESEEIRETESEG